MARAGIPVGVNGPMLEAHSARGQKASRGVPSTA